jgi:hypothetical protein
MIGFTPIKENKMYPDVFFNYTTIRMESDLPFEERMRYFYDVWLPEQTKIYGDRLIDIGYSEHKIIIENDTI